MLLELLGAGTIIVNNLENFAEILTYEEPAEVKEVKTEEHDPITLYFDHIDDVDRFDKYIYDIIDKYGYVTVAQVLDKYWGIKGDAISLPSFRDYEYGWNDKWDLYYFTSTDSLKYKLIFTQPKPVKDLEIKKNSAWEDEDYE